MKKLVVIDACIRGEESRTRRIAEPIIETLSQRYEIIRYDLTKMDIAPLTPATYAERAAGNVPAWALEAAKTVAEADRIVVVAPFWDMSFPAVVKVFFEHLSLLEERQQRNLDFLASVDTSHMSASAKKTHVALQKAIARREEIEEKIESTTRFGVRLATSF